MNVREMHIEIDQSTQLVAANRSRRWYPEEKDWVLNKMMDRYIQNCLRPKKDVEGNLTGGFEVDQVGAEDIKTLLKLNQPLIPYIEDNGRYKCFLPADYKYLISDGSYTKLLCGTTATTANTTLYITSLRQDYSDGTAPFYAALELIMNGVSTMIPDDLPYGNSYIGYPTVEDISFLIPWLLWKSGYRWERFADLYYPKRYIHVTTTSPSNPSVEVDGDIFTEFDIVTKILARHTNTEGEYTSNRLTASDILANMRGVAFFGTAYWGPLTELSDDILWVYRDNSFIVSRVDISYIRKPQPISLSLNTDCELGEGAHQKICDLAVEYLQGRTKDIQGKQLSEADLVKRVIL